MEVHSAGESNCPPAARIPFLGLWVRCWLKVGHVHRGGRNARGPWTGASAKRLRGGEIETGPKDDRRGWDRGRNHLQGLFWDIGAPSKGKTVTKKTMECGDSGRGGVPKRPGLHFTSCRNPGSCGLSSSKQPRPQHDLLWLLPAALPLCPQAL